MQLQTALLMVSVGQTQEIEVSLYHDYSGYERRQSTTGVRIGSQADINLLVFEIGVKIGSVIPTPSVNLEEVREDIQNLHIDQLGKGFIVY